MYPDDLFKTYKIVFCNHKQLDYIDYEYLRSAFRICCNICKDLITDIGYSDMIFSFDSEDNFKRAINRINKFYSEDFYLA